MGLLLLWAVVAGVLVMVALATVHVTSLPTIEEQPAPGANAP